MKYDIDKLIVAPNIAVMLSDDEAQEIAIRVNEGFIADKASREGWEQDHAGAMRLALQVTEQKSEPWEGAANIAFPLVTIAALQWHARAYSLLCNGTDLVKCRVIGTDPDGKKTAIAKRIATHMSWQLLEEDEDWEAEQDKTLLVQGIMGCAFKKTYWDTARRMMKSVLVFPQDLVVNYWTKGDINKAGRATHVIPYTHNRLHERVMLGQFIGYDEHETRFYTEPLMTMMEEATIAREGVERPTEDRDTPCEMLEQLCWFDLDDDGYAEPYIATVERDSTRLRRLVARFTSKDIVRNSKNEVVCIEPETIYTKYSFIPAPDGGFYDLGLGRLLGPLNDSVNTLINQLIDAGTLSNYGGGFLGRGARFKSGDNRFKPMEWKNVESSGDDLRKNLVPLPVREPSQILMSLVQFLVGYGERIASATETQMGENPGQNTPAETMRTMNENGQRVFAATFKRTWRAERHEFRVRFIMNRRFVESEKEYENLSTGAGATIMASDYMEPESSVRPAADPTVVSKEQQQRQAQIVMQNAMTIPGHNRYKSIRRVYEALDVPNIDEVFPPPKPPQPQPGQPPQQQQGEPDIPTPPNPKLLQIQIQQGKLELEKQDQQYNQKLGMLELKREISETQAIIIEKQARAMKMIAEARGVDKQHEVNMLNAQIAAHKAGLDALMKAADIMGKEYERMNRGDNSEGKSGNGGGAAGAGMAASPTNAGVPGMAPGASA